MKIISKMTLDELRHSVNDWRAEMNEYATRSEDLNGEDADKFDVLESDVREATDRIKQIEDRSARIASEVAGGTRSTEDGVDTTNPYQSARPVANKPDPLKGALTLNRDQSFVDWTIANGSVKPEHRDLSFDKYVLGTLTGDWGKDSEVERSLSVGTSTAGGVLVPSPIANGVIELARNKSQALRAGVQVAPMTSSTLVLPRLVGDPGPAWRNENAAVAQNDLTFDSVTLKAQSISRLVRISRELIQDAPGASNVIAEAFAASFAAEIDRAILRGSGTAPEPRGLLNTPGVTVVNWGGANGGAVGFDALLDAQGTIAGYNYTADGHILAPRSQASLAKAKNTQGDYLVPPSGLAPIYTTGSIPLNNTTGTSTDTSEAYTAQGGQIVLGVRETLELRWLTERYADTGEVAAIGHMRVDVAVLQPKAVVVTKGLRP